MKLKEEKENLPIINELKRIQDYIKSLENIDTKISTLNYVRALLHEVSPMKHHPVDFVAWEKSENVEGNEYNPNSVAPPEMNLLITSIEEDGYTMPIVTNPEEDIIRIVDGFHRRKSESKSPKISQSTYGYLPVTFIREDKRNLDSRMASTVRHNRARGAHDIDLMSNIVKELINMGRNPKWISKHIGMDMDEILRLKQLTGIAALFEDREFSTSKD